MKKNLWLLLSTVIVLSLLLSVLPAFAYTTTYTYDDLGRLTSVAYDNGQVIKYSYDPGGNMLSATHSDNTTLTIVSTDPQDGATDVPVDKYVYANFNENIKPGSGIASIAIKSAGSVISYVYSIDQADLILMPSVNLTASVAYSVYLPKDAVQDSSGHNLSADYSFSFTTQASPSFPVVTGTDPADGATGVSVTQAVYVAFNENIQPGDNFSGIALKTGDTVADTVYSIKDNALTLTPTAPLANSVAYSVYLPARSIQSLAGNSLASPYSFGFTTQGTSIPVTGVSLDKTSDTITPGSSDQLTAIVSPLDATNRNLAWSSNNVTVATVDQSGKVSGVSPGTANIAVTTQDGNYTATCAVTVSYLPALTTLILSGSPDLTYNGTPLTFDLTTLSLSGTDQSGNAFDPTGQSVTWTVTSSSAAVSGSTLTVNGAGQTVVAVSIGSVTSNSLTLNVSQAAPTLVALSLSNAPSLTYNGTPLTLDLSTLTLAGTDQFGQPFDASGQPITWSVVSGNAAVSGTTLTIGSDGQAVITASSGSITSNPLTLTVTRATPVLTTLNLSGNPTLTYNYAPFTFDLATLTLTGADQFGNAYDISGQSVSWSVDSGNATVSGSTLTINSAGQVSLTASIGQIASNILSLSVGQPPEPPSSDATLSSLAVSEGTLALAFTSKRTSYADTLDYGTASVTVTATVYESHATLTVNGYPVSSGQPSQAISLTVGSNPVKILVTAQNGTTTKIYNLNVKVKPPVIKIGPGYLPAVIAEISYSQTFTASGGAGPYTFTESGTLPSGISFNVDTLSGTTLTTGSYPVVITATDANGFTGARKYTLTVKAPTIKLSPGSLPAATAEKAYTETLTASGGIGPYAFTETGTLPDGITLTSDGTLSGTTISTGSYPVTITATDANGFTGTRKYTLTVKAPTITISPALLALTAEKPYSKTFTASGGIGPYAFTATGALPDGLSFNNGTLSGTTTTTGTFAITITATDADGFTGTRTCTLTVKAPTVNVKPATLPTATRGKSYKATFIASGGLGPYMFTESGTLPAGLSLSNNILSGTPTETGTFSFTITATDANGFTGAKDYTLTV